MNNTALETSSVQLSADELSRAKAHLEESREGLLAAVAGLSEAQLRFKPAPECWCAADNLEHLVIIGGLFDRRMADFHNGPAPEGERLTTESMIAQALDRTRKLVTPPPACPTGQIPSVELPERIRAANRRTIELLESTPGLHLHTMVHPALGVLDGYQWMILVGAHWKRHTLQILELKAHPEFPQN